MIERVRKRVGGGGNYFAAPKTTREFIPTGSKLLDLCLGGGWAEGTVANIVGDKSTGKTLLCIEACANFAKKHPKGLIFYREAEAAFDRGYAQALGMPIDRVDFGDPLETVEDMFEDMSRVLAKLNKPSLYIVDSLDALSDRAEMERDMDKGSYGAEKAKKMSQMFRRLIRQMHEHMTMIIVSQVRDKIGVSFGRTTTRTGGRALDFYASHVLYLAHIGKIPQTIKKISRPAGVQVRAKVDKNKVSLPFRECEFDIRFGFGIDDILSCLRWLDEVGHVRDVVPTNVRSLKEYTVQLMSGHDDEYHSALYRIHDAVQQRWYEIEKSFLPTRRKYQ